MGYRLTTDTPIKPPIDGIRSEGVTLGAVQLPADGCPIIMLNDHQTIGGYMKIGSICRADLPQLAQALPGTEVTLYPISVELAQRRLRHQMLRIPKTLPL
jgi:allophanate hydrolase subunit 2